MKICDNPQCSRHCEIQYEKDLWRFKTGFKISLGTMESYDFNNGVIIKGKNKSLGFCRICFQAIKLAVEISGLEIETE